MMQFYAELLKSVYCWNHHLKTFPKVPGTILYVCF